MERNLSAGVTVLEKRGAEPFTAYIRNEAGEFLFFFPRAWWQRGRNREKEEGGEGERECTGT